MWEAIKNVLIGVKDATGIEIPGLPDEIGTIGESAGAVIQTVTESAGGVVDGAAPEIGAVTDVITGASIGGVSESAAGVSDVAAAAVDSAVQGQQDSAGGSIEGAQK